MSKTITNELIATAVKIRTSKGITQEDIANRTGLKQQQISRMETGKAVPTLETFAKYLNDIDCELNIIHK